MFILGASFFKHRFLDFDRIENAKQQLFAIGGQSVTLKTPDGDLIDGMYLGVKEFKVSLEKYFDLHEFEDDEGNISQKLLIKEMFCIPQERKSYITQSKYILLENDKNNKELENFIQILNDFDLELVPVDYKTNSSEISKVGMGLELGNLNKELRKLKFHEEGASNPTALLMTRQIL